MDRRRILIRAGAALCTASLTAAAWADLPAGWSVHTFTGRIHEIEPAGGVLACATDGGLLFFDPSAQSFAPAIADAGCTDGNCLQIRKMGLGQRQQRRHKSLHALTIGVWALTRVIRK